MTSTTPPPMQRDPDEPLGLRAVDQLDVLLVGRDRLGRVEIGDRRAVREAAQHERRRRRPRPARHRGRRGTTGASPRPAAAPRAAPPPRATRLPGAGSAAGVGAGAADLPASGSSLSTGEAGRRGRGRRGRRAGVAGSAAPCALHAFERLLDDLRRLGIRAAREEAQVRVARLGAPAELGVDLAERVEQLRLRIERVRRLELRQRLLELAGLVRLGRAIDVDAGLLLRVRARGARRGEHHRERGGRDQVRELRHGWSYLGKSESGSHFGCVVCGRAAGLAAGGLCGVAGGVAASASSPRYAAWPPGREAWPPGPGGLAAGAGGFAAAGAGFVAGGAFTATAGLAGSGRGGSARGFAGCGLTSWGSCLAVSGVVGAVDLAGGSAVRACPCPAGGGGLARPPRSGRRAGGGLGRCRSARAAAFAAGLRLGRAARGGRRR